MDKSNRLEFLENYLLMNKICKFQTLLKKTNSSSITLRRDLLQLKAITSYSHKGQYITLSGTPVYNDDGIWEYESIMFTRFKNSYELILNIIESAVNGITQEEISKKINLNISKQIQILLSRNQLNRIKVRREYFYISNKLANSKNPKLKLLRSSQLEEYCDVNIKTSDLIALLRMALAESKLQLKYLNKLLKKYSINLSVEKAEQIIIKYDLIQKKKAIELLASLRFKHQNDTDVLNQLLHLTIRLTGAESCPICNTKSKTLKTTRRKCYSYQLGEFNLIETISYCSIHKYSNLNSKTYLKIKPDFNTTIVEYGHQVAIDLIVKIGLLRFRDNFQLHEIQSFLKTPPCNISLSIPTIGRVSKQFLIYCKKIHNLHEDIIRRDIEDNGGYILHFDATTEIFAGKVNYVFRDSLSKHILLSIEAPSEKHLYIFPALKEIKKKYGTPLMTMSDLKSGSLTVVEDVFKKDACHVFCHYHFLRTFNVDFAKDHAFVKTKLSRKYGPATILREELKICKLTRIPFPSSLKTYKEIEITWIKTKDIQVTYYYILQWVLRFKQESSGKGVPFDLPYIDLWERILKAEKLIKKIFKKSNSKHRTRISDMINEIKKGIQLKFSQAIETSKYRHKWFNKLRIALVYIDKKEDMAPLSKKYYLTKKEAEKLAGNIEIYIGEIDKEITKEKCEVRLKILNRFKKQTLKYADNLIVPTFEVINRDGSKQTIIGPRTNNSLEAFFREGKSNLRRKSGKSSIVKEFSSIGGLLPYYIALKKHKSFSKIMAEERIIINEITKLITPKKLSKENIIAFPQHTIYARKPSRKRVI